MDIGAGNGYFSLAAAARGHRVIAFELSNKSLASFEASVAYNGFGKMVTLHKVASQTVHRLNMLLTPPHRRLPLCLQYCCLTDVVTSIHPLVGAFAGICLGVAVSLRGVPVG